MTGARIMRIDVATETWPLARVFAISRGAKVAAEVVTVTIAQGGARGRGECVPYARYGETPASVTAQIAGLSLPIDRAALQSALPAGAARNAVDCALWDLEAKLAGRRVWDIAGLPPPRPCVTAYTLSLDTPAAMEAQARDQAARPLLKIKLARQRTCPGSKPCGAARRARGSSSTPTKGGAQPSMPTLPRICGGSGSKWSNSRCRPGPTVRWSGWRAPSRSAPTRAVMTGPRNRGWRENMTS